MAGPSAATRLGMPRAPSSGVVEPGRGGPACRARNLSARFLPVRATGIGLSRPALGRLDTVVVAKAAALPADVRGAAPGWVGASGCGREGRW